MTYNTLLKTTLIGTFVCLGFVHAGEEVDQTIAVQADGNVEIANVRGIVRVKGWDRDEVSVTGELDDKTEKFIFETNGSSTVIKVELPRGRLGRGDGSDLTIRVPFKNSVDFSGVSSDFVAEEIAAGVNIRTVSGDIEVEDIETMFHLKSVSGDIIIKDSSGEARLNSVSGDINGSIDSDTIEVSQVSGDIQLRLKEYSKLDAGSVSGDIWIKGSQKDGGQARAKTVSGDIDLIFVGGLNAIVKGKTGPGGGSIKNDLTSDSAEEGFPNSRKLRITVGSGDGTVSFSTISGTIKLSEG